MMCLHGTWVYGCPVTESSGSIIKSQLFGIKLILAPECLNLTDDEDVRASEMLYPP